MTYLFRIQIKGFKNPEVWRQIEVPAHYSFSQFHEVITIVFSEGQNNSRFSFSPHGKGSKPQIIFTEFPFNDSLPAKATLLLTVFKRQGQTYIYFPDFDEKWMHTIVLEEITSKVIPYADCLAGEGAYPPDTCENIEDYEDMKQALSDKNHPQHKSVQEWLELDENETWDEKYSFDISNVNERLKYTGSNTQLFRNYIVIKHDTFDEKYDLHPSLWKTIDKKNEQFQKGKNKIRVFQDMEKLVQEYPHIPHFKNMLAILYAEYGEKKRFLTMEQQIMKEYPDYILARCNLAIWQTENNRCAKAFTYLGKKFDLSELYPGRNGHFTEIEIYNYHYAVFRYLLKIKNTEDAQQHLDFLEYLFPKRMDERLHIELTLVRMEKMTEEIKDQKMVKVIPEEIVPTNKEPNFENPEINLLYEQDANIKREIFHRIIELPRESVIKDLEKILIDSIARFDYFRKNTQIEVPDAPIHALNLLAAMKAEETLDTLFSVFRQDSSYYDFWYGDMLTEDFWRFTYMIGQNRLDRLKDFVLEPNRYTFVRTMVSDALMQIAFHQQERKEEVLEWYEDVIQYMLDHRNDTQVFESRVYISWLEDMLKVAGKEQLPVILRLYDESLLEKQDRFSLHEIKKWLVSPTSNFKIYDIYTSIDQYYDSWQRWANKDDKFDTPTPFISEPEVGRNDPCPCGSGKKYKKCCGAG